MNQEVCEDEQVGWDDVKDQELNAGEVKAARKEEVGYMEAATSGPLNRWPRAGRN